MREQIFQYLNSVTLLAPFERRLLIYVLKLEDTA